MKPWLDYHPNLRASLQHEIDTRDNRIKELKQQLEEVQQKRIKSDSQSEITIRQQREEITELRQTLNRLTNNQEKIVVIPSTNFDPQNCGHQQDLAMQVASQLK